MLKPLKSIKNLSLMDPVLVTTQEKGIHCLDHVLVTTQEKVIHCLDQIGRAHV